MCALISSDLQEVQREIVRFFTEVYTPRGGVPFFAVHARTGERPAFHSMLAEFADWAPFLYLAGAVPYVKEQFEILARRVESRWELTTPYAGWKRAVFPARVNVFHYTDLTLGLLDLSDLGWQGPPLTLADRMFRKVVARHEENGWICQWRLPAWNVRVPVAETTSALFVELALDLAEKTGDPAYPAWARQWGDRFVTLPFFGQTGVFPEHVVLREAFWNRFVRTEPRSARLAKHNLAVAAAFLALWRATREMKFRQAIDWWHQGVRRHFLTDSGGASSIVAFSEKGEVVGRKPPHIKNHGMTDLLCDLAFFLEDPVYLETARRVVDFWISQQSAHTGLLPFEPGSRVSYLDGETDWTVALLKLSELTGEQSYRESAFRILAGVFRHHRTDAGFANGVDIETGEVVDDLVETRYGALLLKPVLFLQAGVPLYADRKRGGFWWKILLDR